MGIAPRRLDLFFGDGIAKEISLVVLKARKNPAALMENPLRIGVGAAPDHRGKPLGIVVFGQERIEATRRLRLRNHGIDAFVPIILNP